MIKDAPNFDAGAPLSPQDEDTLYTHYGRVTDPTGSPTPGARQRGPRTGRSTAQNHCRPGRRGYVGTCPARPPACTLRGCRASSAR